MLFAVLYTGQAGVAEASLLNMKSLPLISCSAKTAIFIICNDT